MIVQHKLNNQKKLSTFAFAKAKPAKPAKATIKKQKRGICLSELIKDNKVTPATFLPLALTTKERANEVKAFLGENWKISLNSQMLRQPLVFTLSQNKLQNSKKALKKQETNLLGASKNIFWGTLLFSRGDVAFVNLRGLLSSLLKALHVCLFAKLNNKRIIFVADQGLLVREQQQKLLNYFIGSQVNGSETKFNSLFKHL